MDPLPALTTDELARLRDAITADVETVKKTGLDTPVILAVVNGENFVVDGRARVVICEELRIDWAKGAKQLGTMTLEEAVCKRIQMNRDRRSSKPSKDQLRQIAGWFLKLDPTQSDAVIAKMVGCSHVTVHRTRHELLIRKELSEVTETTGLDGKVRKRSSTYVNGQRDLARVVDAYKTLGDDGPEGRISTYELQRDAKEAKRREEVAKLPLAKIHGLHHCDFRNLDVAPGSVSLLFTDVLWAGDQENEWRELARLASTWLAPGGLFVSWIGSYALGRFVSVMQEHLRWQDCFMVAYQHGVMYQERNGVKRGGQVLPIFSRQEIEFFSFPGISNVIGSARADKHLHKYQQTLEDCEEIVKRLTKAGDLVVDPCMGTGTNLLAAAKNGCHFLGCDRDPEMVRIASGRLAEYLEPTVEVKHAAA